VIKYQNQDFSSGPFRTLGSSNWKPAGLIIALVLFSLFLLFGYGFISRSLPKFSKNNERKILSSIQAVLPEQLDYYSSFENYPEPDTFSYHEHQLAIFYQSDSLLNARMRIYLDRYRPEIAVYLACDLQTGQILALAERKDSVNSSRPDMAFGGTYPAASLIKLVPVLAALEAGKTPYDSLVQIGSYHTLYKYQLRPHLYPDAPKVTLKKAFARSVNPAFGLLGRELGGSALRKYGKVLGFNNHERPDRLEISRLTVPDSGYNLAEVSCGFIQSTTISPIHALEMARMIGWQGRRLPCVFSDSLQILLPGGSYPVRYKQKAASELSPHIMSSLQELMQATIYRGTGRRQFHRIMRRHHLEKLVLGGKSGSLDGPEPNGRYDWFIGYARLKDDPQNGIAIAVMHVYQTYQSMRAGSVAALLIRDWLRSRMKSKKMVS
jgi:cell division protein FtsI/penicillin-binding protein 2